MSRNPGTSKNQPGSNLVTPTGKPTESHVAVPWVLCPHPGHVSSRRKAAPPLNLDAEFCTQSLHGPHIRDEEREGQGDAKACPRLHCEQGTAAPQPGAVM